MTILFYETVLVRAADQSGKIHYPAHFKLSMEHVHTQTGGARYFIKGDFYLDFSVQNGVLIADRNNHGKLSDNPIPLEDLSFLIQTQFDSKQIAIRVYHKIMDMMDVHFSSLLVIKYKLQDDLSWFGNPKIKDDYISNLIAVELTKEFSENWGNDKNE